MKFIPLIWAGLWRNPGQTTLSLLAVAVAFLLFGTLDGVTATIDGFINNMSDTRLRVSNLSSPRDPLPLSAVEQIERVDGVRAASHYTAMGASYQDVRQAVPAGAVDMKRMLQVYPEYLVSPQAREAMERTRTAAIVGRDLAAMYGWKIGDRVPLISSRWARKDGSPVWTFDIVGIYEIEDNKFPANELLFNYDYLEEGRATGSGLVSNITVGIANAKEGSRISADIDRLFANSSAATSTLDEKSWRRARNRQVGNLSLFVNAVVAAALFALLFVTGNTMIESIRTRAAELATLMALGFSRSTAIALVLAESLILCITAAVAGLALATFVFPMVFKTMRLGEATLPLRTIEVALLAATVLALLSTVIPAVITGRLRVSEALAAR